MKIRFTTRASVTCQVRDFSVNRMPCSVELHDIEVEVRLQDGIGFRGVGGPEIDLRILRPATGVFVMNSGGPPIALCTDHAAELRDWIHPFEHPHE